MNRAAARHFPDTKIGWPKVPQADYLAPDGYDVAYVTNAVTRDGEHGNALLSRWPIGDVGHHDVSDHRFEQRGRLHAPVTWNGTLVHAIVAHFRPHARQPRAPEIAALLGEFIAARRCRRAKAGDRRRRLQRLGRKARRPDGKLGTWSRVASLSPATRRRATTPSRRGCRCSRWTASTCARPALHVDASVPRGPAWARMSDHLPLVAELELE